MTTNYCTLADAKLELKAQTTSDDEYLRRAIFQASRRIDLELSAPSRAPVFAPFIETRKYVLDVNRVNSAINAFWTYSRILAVSSVLIDTTDVTSDIEIYPAYPDAGWNKALRLTTRSRDWYRYCTTSILDPLIVTVTGTWGYSSDYANAWQTADALAADIDDSVTAITVADADGTDWRGFTPRFSPGAFIRIGTEFMHVDAVDTSTNTLTVRRGANGSTAAAHTAGDDIDVYVVEDDINRITARHAATLYARRGAFDNVSIPSVGDVPYPSDLLLEMKAVLSRYANLI